LKIENWQLKIAAVPGVIVGILVLHVSLFFQHEDTKGTKEASTTIDFALQANHKLQMQIGNEIETVFAVIGALCALRVLVFNPAEREVYLKL
jgi:hypothetical protein